MQLKNGCTTHILGAWMRAGRTAACFWTNVGFWSSLLWCSGTMWAPDKTFLHAEIRCPYCLSTHLKDAHHIRSVYCMCWEHLRDSRHHQQSRLPNFGSALSVRHRKAKKNLVLKQKQCHHQQNNTWVVLQETLQHYSLSRAPWSSLCLNLIEFSSHPSLRHISTARLAKALKGSARCGVSHQTGCWIMG